MSEFEIFVTIALAAIGTAATRYLPFLVFNSNKPTPKYLVYLGKALPPAVFGMLVVYCLKALSFTDVSGYLPELLAIALTVGVHLAFRKMLVSVTAGMAAYIVLVNFIFI
ncbi:MAG: AzlD domain-containing protein [Clostridia bacterium]|nr:AzlD domain-containing protein [Clostridia bacterium]